ncbi:MAG: copper amine oxidase N-terminal domain-containing protein [Clostridia bacterium]|nr:copper amine oxidase N-terminal domain-containing protein [Clostridia bacterium]
MKKVLSVLMITIMLFLTMMFPVSADNGEISVYLDAAKIEFDVKPQIINGRTMVPIRAIFEKMGAVVEWDGNTSSAICTKGDTVVKMTVNSMDMYINNQLTKMDISPVVIDGRTLAPARYVAEAFGADVQWSQKNNTVVICSKDVYAYADYPDIPDLGRCYNIPLLSETNENGFKALAYSYSDMANDDYYSYLYDNSALVLGGYAEEVAETRDDMVLISYTKRGETTPRYYVGASYDAYGSMVFVVMIPLEETVEVVENKVILYALDGRTIEVLESEVPAYLNVGWYRTLAETQQIMYAPDGRTITIFKSEVAAYKNAGWYETQSAAQAANKITNNTSNSNNPSADGYYYRTPTGKKYHLDPNCGGKNSYRTSNISGLSPCSKCAK